MPQNAATASAFDVVGPYIQDEINGYSPRVLDHLISLIQPDKVSSVLDAMAGDGNLSEKIFKYCAEKGVRNPAVTAFEFSQVQADFARMRLANTGATIVWGDILSLRDRGTDVAIAADSYDRVVIKSANHEISRANQADLYSNIYKVLKADGLFVNLGLVFDDEDERDEFRAIARVKDTLAKMLDAAKDRHFLTRAELYTWLHNAGFVDIRTERSFEYRIRSSNVARYYFSGKNGLEADIEHQVAQVRAAQMRRNGRILFERDESLMMLPGEITSARKPTAAEKKGSVYDQYPYDFVRKIETHRALLQSVAAKVPNASSVLDLGCGLGFLFEHLSEKVKKYVGVDISEPFIQACKERYASFPNGTFDVLDLNKGQLPSGTFEVISLINVLYHEGLRPVQLLQRVREALPKDGLLVLSGPISPRSFQMSEGQMRAQLERDGHWEGNEEIFEQIRAANARLLSTHGNYWSAEGIAELLLKLGFSSIESMDNTHFYGQSFLVTARR